MLVLCSLTCCSVHTLLLFCSRHSLTAEQYTAFFDSVVIHTRRMVDPHKQIKFVGLALQNHDEWSYYEYFLDPKNHDPEAGVPDFISFHFYAIPSDTHNITTYGWFSMHIAAADTPL
jgi:hypothetical protein